MQTAVDHGSLPAIFLRASKRRFPRRRDPRGGIDSSSIRRLIEDIFKG